MPSIHAKRTKSFCTVSLTWMRMRLYISSVQQSERKLVDSVLGVLTCHRTCEERIKETRGGSSQPRTAGTAARGGAKTAWHTSASDPPPPPPFPTGSDRRHGNPLAQWGVDSHLTTPHLHDLYHAWPPAGDNHLIANSPTGDVDTQHIQEDTQIDRRAWRTHGLTESSMEGQLVRLWHAYLLVMSHLNLAGRFPTTKGSWLK